MSPDPAASPPSVLSRSAQLLAFMARHRALLEAPAGAGTGAGADREPSVARPATGDAAGGDDAERFAQDVQQLGPAFIKIGQSLSIRPDLLPARHAQALEQLQDDVAEIDFAQVRDTVERELGVRLGHAFAHFEETPLAAASLAQVHAATLRDGRAVVVKVQRPGIEAAIRADLGVLRGFARTADRFTEQGRRVQFGEWIEEMGETLAEELDYRLEADNLRAFRHHLAEHPDLLVPAPVDGLSSQRVLTMERVAGTKVTQAIELKRLEQPLERLASELIRAYLEQIFVHGLVHADPHPGNVMLCDDGRLALVDLGMVVRLGPRLRDGLLRLLGAVVEGDGDTVAHQTRELGEALEMFDERGWQRRCGRLVARYCSRDPRHASGEGALLIELTRLAVASGLRPPPELSVLGRTLLALESVARVLDPSVAARQLVREHLPQVLAERARQQASLHALRTQLGHLVDFGRELPRQASAVLETLARNRLRVQVSGLEESRLLENLQKIANRITAGLISAALVVGAALALRIDAGPRLFGYPGVALVMFVLAFGLAGALVVSVLMSDRHVSRYRARDRGG